MKHLATLTVALSLLGACSSTVKPYEPIEQAALTSPCPDLPDFEGKDMGDLLKHAIVVTELYYECQSKHAGLAGIRREN